MKEKRNNMIKLTAAIFLGILVLSWLLPSAYYNGNQLVEISKRYGHGVGLIDAVSSFFYALTIPALLNNILYIIAIAISFTVVSKLPAYKLLVNKIVLYFKDKKSLLSFCLAGFAILMINLTGSPIAFLMFVPFIMNLLLRSGYAKKEAVSMVILSITAGTMGSVIGEKFYMNIYGALNRPDTLMSFRLIQMVLSTTVVFFGLTQMPKTKEVEFYEVENNHASSLPLVVIGIVMVLIFILSLLSWTKVLNITFFNELVEKMLKPAKNAKDSMWATALTPNIIPFGFWSLQSLIKVMIVSTILVAVLAQMKIDEFVDAVIEGAGKAAKPVIALFIVNGIIALTLMIPFMIPILNNVLKGTDKVVFGLIKLPFFTLFANFFIPNQELLVRLGSPVIINNIKDETLLTSLPMIWQSFSALAMAIMPTSLILASILPAYDVSYVDYFKTAVKYILALVATAIITMVFSAYLYNNLIMDMSKTTKLFGHTIKNVNMLSYVTLTIIAIIIVAIIVLYLIINSRDVYFVKENNDNNTNKGSEEPQLAFPDIREAIETEPAKEVKKEPKKEAAKKEVKETKKPAAKKTAAKKTTTKKATTKKATTKKPAAKKTTTKKTTTKK